MVWGRWGLNFQSCQLSSGPSQLPQGLRAQPRIWEMAFLLLRGGRHTDPWGDHVVTTSVDSPGQPALGMARGRMGI